MNSLAQLSFLTCALWLAPALAFDGTRTPANTKPEVTPIEALRSGAAQLKAGQNDKALISLQYAADQGHALAQWKLGRMYAAGDGVPRNELRAFQYFSRIANTHAEDSPHLPQARFVANAFVQLGHYYLDGIPDTEVKADPDRAREMYAYAASYFGDPDAQYALARILLDGTSGIKDTKQALRWLNLAANKGQPRAQALLGHVIFKGDVVPRQAARGLMWLTLARDAVGGEKWVVDMYDAAFKQASDSERQMAVLYLERYMKGRRD
ncbi:tetratricopeptide repeat protein [Pseudorhodoplanes sp.]|uniref:tetratricopeptide repeat protein n=1 Tax=Pseudorhodoplanes sp. TaxID=1934341 RepID=UPI0039C99309